MPSALTDLRITQFKNGRLELIVTPSEVSAFNQFVRAELPPLNQSQLSEIVALLTPPDQLTMEHAYVFRLVLSNEHKGFDLAHAGVLAPVSMNSARIPFALMSDDIPYLAVKPDPPKTKLDDEWGMEKIELRNKIRGIESNFSILMSAMELLKMQIDSLVKATDAKDAP